MQLLTVTVPAEHSAEVTDLLRGCPGLASLTVFSGAAQVPTGDVIQAEVARESVDGLLVALRGLGVDRTGTLTLVDVDTSVSAAAERAERDAPGDGQDAVIWEQVVRMSDTQSRLTWTFVAFLTIATLIAAIAIEVDSAVLIIGAMVLGPEFGPIAALCVAAVHGRRAIARHAVLSLMVGLAAAIAVTTLCALISRGLGWIDTETLTGDRPATGFITEPDKWSFIVAFIAGVAGVLALTSSKSGSLVGVFISVTTVPAAADLALGLALASPTEIGRSLTQLGINIAALLLAGVLTLLVQKTLWRLVPRTQPTADPGAEP